MLIDHRVAFHSCYLDEVSPGQTGANEVQIIFYHSRWWLSLFRQSLVLRVCREILWSRGVCSEPAVRQIPPWNPDTGDGGWTFRLHFICWFHNWNSLTLYLLWCNICYVFFNFMVSERKKNEKKWKMKIKIHIIIAKIGGWCLLSILLFQIHNIFTDVEWYLPLFNYLFSSYLIPFTLESAFSGHS